jgi:hypothetical protein
LIAETKALLAEVKQRSGDMVTASAVEAVYF